MRPLYNIGQAGNHGHAGLWYDKFCDRWREGWSLLADRHQNPKLDWIKTVCGQPVGDPGLLQEATQRIDALIRARSGRSLVFTSTAAFVTGLGLSHAIETGFLWHPTLGTPYLPASSIKGMLRAWWEAEGATDLAVRLLGGPAQVGGLVMLDALPLRPVQLEPDVVTPHYAGWSAQCPPGDWSSPRPIPYLSLASGATFLFAVHPRKGLEDGDLDRALAGLTEALEWQGAGARTNLGYGRWQPARSETERMQRAWQARAKAAAASTPEGRWRQLISDVTENDVLELIRVHLIKEPIQAERERVAFVSAVRDRGWLPQWRLGKKVDPRTRTGDAKIKERAAVVDGLLKQAGLDI